MNKDNKQEIYEKFKQRSEKEIIKNTGETFLYGDTTIVLKELSWDESEKLEDTILCIMEDFSYMSKQDTSDTIETIKNMSKQDTSDTIETIKNMNLMKFVTKIIKKLLREDILDIANILNSQITLEDIRLHKVSKNQVMEIVVQGIILNYSYLKNLATLATRFK